MPGRTGALRKLLFVIVVYQAIRRQGEVATQAVWDNPNGLEWTVPSPAPYHTFDTPPRISSGVAVPHDG